MSFDEHGKYFVTVGVRFVKFWYFDTNDDKKVSSYRYGKQRMSDYRGLEITDNWSKELPIIGVADNRIISVLESEETLNT